MATIAENLQILVDNKADIKEAIERVIAEDNITLRMSAWADLLNAYEDKLQDATSNTAFPFRFPITFKPEQTISKYFPFSLPLTFTPPPMKVVYNVINEATPVGILHRYAGSPAGLCDAIIIDGVSVPPSSLTTRSGDLYVYKFTTSGEHTIEYEFKNNKQVPANLLRGVYSASNYVITKITVPNLVERVGDVAFLSTRANISIPDSVASIGWMGCYLTGDVEIGTGITRLEEICFREARSVTIHALTPPTLLGNQGPFYAFSGYVYVPAEAVNTYKTATRWAGMANRIKPIPE